MLIWPYQVELVRAIIPSTMPLFLRISATDWLEENKDFPESWYAPRCQEPLIKSKKPTDLPREGAERAVIAEVTCRSVTVVDLVHMGREDPPPRPPQPPRPY